MELVYLWVEKYKNIKKQGFNFSPRFQCEYDGETLTIDKNDGYISDFFGENINVTAIVGKNGSGKSSVLEMIAKIIANNIENYKYILLVKTEDNLVCLHSLDNLIVGDSIEVRSDFNESYFIFNSNNISNGYFDMQLDSFSSKNYRFYSETKLRNQSTMNLLANSSRLLEAHDLDSMYVSKHSFFIRDIFPTFYIGKFLMQLDFISKLNSVRFPFSFPNIVELSIKHNRNTASIQGDNFSDKIKKCIISKRQGDSLEFDQYNFTIEEENFLNFLGRFSDKRVNDIIELDLVTARELINLYTKVKIDFFDLKWHNLSSGEEAFLNLYTLLLHGIEGIRGKNKMSYVVVAFDEIESNLHPAWQKKLFNNLLIFLNFLKKHYARQNFIINIQLLFSTHSPFILSDIPKQNIIFLDKDEQGNCKVVDGLNDKKQTFGANIHTLLSDSFFMDGGLMGEFAKKKIDRVITILNQEKPNKKDLKYCEKIIPIIGEPIVKNQLQKMLDSKKLPKVGEIAKIHQDIKKLQSRLKDLEVDDDKK